MPALLKGFIDRALTCDWAFRYDENGMPQGLLAGRTGRLMVTSDSPAWYLPLVGDTTMRHLKRTTLQFCGIKPVRSTRFTAVRRRTDDERAAWLRTARDLGAGDAHRIEAATPGRARIAA